MSTNIVVATFDGANVIQTEPRWQWSYGQILQFEGFDLPSTFTVHFSNQNDIGTAKGEVGRNNAVAIPDQYLTTGLTVFAWVFLHAGANDGETVYAIIIPIIKRPKPTDEEPTPVQQSEIETAIAALNAGVATIEAAMANYVIGIEDNTNYLLVDNLPEAAKHSLTITVDGDSYIDIKQPVTE